MIYGISRAEQLQLFVDYIETSSLTIIEVIESTIKDGLTPIECETVIDSFITSAHPYE